MLGRHGKALVGGVCENSAVGVLAAVVDLQVKHWQINLIKLKT